MANSEPPTPHFPGWYPPTPGTPASDAFSTKDGSAVGASGADDEIPAFVGQDLSVDSTKPQRFNYEQGGILDEAGRKLASGAAVGTGAALGTSALAEADRTPTEEKTNPVDQRVGLGLADVQTEDPTASNGELAAATSSSEPGAKEGDGKDGPGLGERAGGVAAVLGGATAAVAGALGVKSFQEKELEEARAIESGDSARASGAGADSSLLPAPASSSLATQPISEASSSLADPNTSNPETITTASTTSTAPAADENSHAVEKEKSNAAPSAALGAAALGAGALGKSGFQDHELQEARAHEAGVVDAEQSGALAQPVSSLDSSAPAATGTVAEAPTSSTSLDEPAQPPATGPEHDKSSTFVPAAVAGAALVGTGTAAALAHDGSESTPKAITQPLPSTDSTVPVSTVDSSTPTAADAASKNETTPSAGVVQATSPPETTSLIKDPLPRGTTPKDSSPKEASPKDSSPKPKEKSALKSALAAVGIGRKDKDKKVKADESAEPNERKAVDADAKAEEKSGKDSDVGKAALAGGALAGTGALIAGQHGDELVAPTDRPSQTADPVVQQSSAPIDQTLSHDETDVAAPSASNAQSAALATAVPTAAVSTLDSKPSDSLTGAPVQQQQSIPSNALSADATTAAALEAHNAALATHAPHALAPAATSDNQAAALATNTAPASATSEDRLVDGVAAAAPGQATSPNAPNLDAARAAALQAHNAALAKHAPHVLPIPISPSDPNAAALAAHSSALATHAPHAVGGNDVIAGQSPAFPPAGESIGALSGAGGVTNESVHPARIDQLRAGGADAQGGYKHGKAIIHYGAPGTETDIGHRPNSVRETDSFVSDFPGGPVRRLTEDGADSNSSTQALVGTPVNEAQKELSLDTADEKRRISSPLAAAAIAGTAGSAAVLAAAHEHDAKEGGASSTGHTARKLSRKRKSVIKKDDDAATALASQKAEEDARRQRENEVKRDAMFATMGAGRDPTVGKPSSPKQSSVFSHSRPGSTGAPASVASLDTGVTTGRDGHSPTSASPSGKRRSVLRRHHGTSESGASDASGGSGTELKKQDHSGHHITQPFPSSDAGDTDRRHRRTTSVGSASHRDGYASDGTRSRKNTLKRRSHYEAIAREHEEQLQHERDVSSASANTFSDADRRTANSSVADNEVESDSGIEGIEGGKRKKKGSLFRRIFSKGDKEKAKEAEQSAQ